MNKKALELLNFYIKFFIFTVYTFSSASSSTSSFDLTPSSLPLALGTPILKERTYYEAMKGSFKSLMNSLSQFVEGSTDSNGMGTPHSRSCSGILFRNNLASFNRFKEACTTYIDLTVGQESSSIDFLHPSVPTNSIAEQKAALYPLIFEGIMFILTDIKEWSAINTENIKRHNDLVGQKNDTYVNGRKQKPLCPIGLQGTINIGRYLRDFLETHLLTFHSFLDKESLLIFPTPHKSDAFFDQNDEDDIPQYDKTLNLIVSLKSDVMMVLQRFEQALEGLNSVKKEMSSKKHRKKKKDNKTSLPLDL